VEKKSEYSHARNRTNEKGSIEKNEDAHASGGVYLYKDSGIRERHGIVPLWLQIVSYGLIIWGIYYTIRYWGTGKFNH
jgi:hypothetical protein